MCYVSGQLHLSPLFYAYDALFWSVEKGFILAGF